MASVTDDKGNGITFDLPKDQHDAVKAISAGRKVRISGEVRDGKFVVDNLSFATDQFSKPLFVAVNAPFKTVQTLHA